MPAPIGPDNSKPIFSAPETVYSFHAASHVFSGQNSAFMAPSGMQGLCFIVARFNYVGELQEGTIKVVGRIPDEGINQDSTLLQGTIIDVNAFWVGPAFSADFLFRIDESHAQLGYTSHLGVWDSYMIIPGWPQHYLRYLFRRRWGPASAPLNSYIGQVSSIV